MAQCKVNNCDQPVSNSASGLCRIHAAHREWLDNSDIDNLGIVKFSQFLFPQRINSKYGVPRMHKEIYYDLLSAMVHGETKMDRQHCVAAPREHSKSTIICFVFVMYCILFRKKSYIVIITESYDKSTQYIRQIKKALSSPVVKEYFGDVTARYIAKEDSKKWSEGHIVTATGITILALGAGKSARGLVEDTRPDLIIGDDIESENNTKTPESRQATWLWWKAAVVPAADIIAGQVIYIGTMVHYDCTLAKLMEQNNKYKKRFYQVFTDPTQTATIWPEKFTLELVRDIEKEYRSDPTLGYGMFCMEYLNIATNPEEKAINIYKAEYQFKRNSASSYIFFEGKWWNVRVFMGVDPASSLKNSAKYTGIVVGAMDILGRLFVLHEDMNRRPSVTDPETNRVGVVDIVCDLCLEYGIETIGWELDGVGRPIYQALRAKIMEKRIRTQVKGLEAPHDIAKIDKIKNHLELAHNNRLVIQRESHVALGTAQAQFPKTRYMDILEGEVNCLLVAKPPTEIIPYTEIQDRLDTPNPSRFTSTEVQQIKRTLNSI